jgi:dipeptidyl aminopeptidase/acylaminoacyl peptidase
MNLTIAPYGSWQSPVTTEMVAGGSTGLSALAADGECLYWLESRPSEAGRSTLIRWTADGVTELTPKPRDVGTRVHEYGGGAYAVCDGSVVFSDRRDASVWLIGADGGLRKLAHVEGCRYADFCFDGRRNRIIAVREDHRDRPPSDPANVIVALDMSADAAANAGTVLVKCADFVAAPRLSADGMQLLWLQWNHPDMPWDATQLFAATLDAAGSPGPALQIAGQEREAVMQPEWEPAGSILFLSDRTGWWNLYRADHGTVTPVAAIETDIGSPAWQLAARAYTRLDDGDIVATLIERGRRRPALLSGGAWIDLPTGAVAQAPVGFGGGLAMIATPLDRPPSIAVLRATRGVEITTIREATSVAVGPDDVAVGEPIEFPTEDGETAHAFFYPPRNSRFQAEAPELPPLVVLIHGGPTSMTNAGYSMAVQWWTTRGIAVVDVNYRGSAGYGRAYRRRLEGAWGVADVDDCIAAVAYLVGRGDVDPERIAIRGGSAGGFTVLSALTRSSLFKAGASLYGVADLMLLAKETHKFEARYLDRLIGPLPAAEAIYRDRSPLGRAERIAAPVIFFQGAEDKVVPPNQTEQMVEAMRRNRLPVAYYLFPGEGHGFRRAETIRSVLELELDFYAQIFGFEASDLSRSASIQNWPPAA